MRSLTKYILTFAAAMLAAVSCIYDFNPEFVGQSGHMVIEGDILIGDITTVTINTTQKLISSAMDAKIGVDRYMTYGYTVKVIDSDGNETVGSIEGPNQNCPNDHFEIDTRFLDPSRNYKLEVVDEGSGLMFDGSKIVYTTPVVYSTPWLEPLRAQKIDSLSWALSESGRNLEFRVSSSGESGSPYVRWIGRETWEYVTPLYAYCYYLPAKNSMYEYQNGENTHYCWNNGSVPDVMVADVSETSDRSIVDYRVYSYPRESIKISYLYRVDMIQEALTEEAYKYWKTTSRNTGEIGGLFSSQPSEIRGNIVNEKYPDQQVIGFISASVVSKCRFYFDNNGRRIGTYHVEVPEVNVVNIVDWRRYYDMGYLPFSIHEVELPNGDIITDPNVYDWYPRRCIDCTSAGGNKAKPSDWPNDHK